MQKFGSPKDIVSFVIPTGYSFNLDGSTLYQAIAAIFIAQMYGIDLSIMEQITLVLVLMITSNGIAGVPGVSFVVLLATLGTVGIPLEGLAFIAGSRQTARHGSYSCQRTWKCIGYSCYG